MNNYETYLKDQMEDGVGWKFDKLVKYCDDFIEKTKMDVRGKMILDLGCREFHAFQYFKEKYDTEIIGTDIGTEGHIYARGLKRPSIFVDAHDMSLFNTEAFDAILAIHVLEHMYDLGKVINECARILKPGGIFYVAVPFPCKNLHKGHWQEITDIDVFNASFTDKFEITHSKVAVSGDEENLRGAQEYFLILKRK